ncbi:MAG: hypothetical protein AABN34_24390 [Acidobacteriota bacterium]
MFSIQEHFAQVRRVRKLEASTGQLTLQAYQQCSVDTRLTFSVMLMKSILGKAIVGIEHRLKPCELFLSCSRRLANGTHWHEDWYDVGRIRVPGDSFVRAEHSQV